MFCISSTVYKATRAVRGINSSRNAVGRASGLLKYSVSPSRQVQNNKVDSSSGDFLEPFIAFEKISSLTSNGFHTVHRPSISLSGQKVIPLMQGFRTSAPKQAIHRPSTVDCLVFPSPPTEPSSTAKVRVPLLPDNYSPDRSPNSVNANYNLDVVIPRPEISIIASHPQDVLPITISEIVGSETLEMHLSHLTRPFSN